jgi:hypothetical protein
MKDNEEKVLEILSHYFPDRRALEPEQLKSISKKLCAAINADTKTRDKIMACVNDLQDLAYRMDAECLNDEITRIYDDTKEINTLMGLTEYGRDIS